MAASFADFKVQWELVSIETEADRVTYKYESALPKQFHPRKCHMTKVVSPQGVFISVSTI